MRLEDAKFLIFDTETTGLPEKGHEDDIMKFIDTMPRVFQLAAHVTNYKGEVIDKFSEFIYPDGWEIPQEEFWINHGYSTERCIKEGVPIKEGLDFMVKYMEECTHIVAHNYRFDRSLLLSELIKNNYRADLLVNPPKPLCTMLTTIELVNAPFAPETIARCPWLAGKAKFPKLEELHRYLFQEEMENAHDAEWDLFATHRCLIELIKRGVIFL